MKVMMLVVALVALSGCTTVRHMYAAPGQKQFVVTCGTGFPQKCEERAVKECRGKRPEVVGQRRGLEGLEVIFRC